MSEQIENKDYKYSESDLKKFAEQAVQDKLSELEKLQQYTALLDIKTATSNASTSSLTYDVEDLERYMANPLSYASELRQVSDTYYMSNGIYRNVINAFSNILTLDHQIIPSSKTMERVTDKAYTTYLDKVTSYFESINIKTTTRNILKSVAKYGGYIGYERQEGDEYYLQTLPLDYCRIKCRIGHDFQIEFNFKYFDKFYQQEDLDFAFSLYPKEFQKLYNKYKSDNVSRTPEWQMLDVTRTRCILADDDDAVFIPMFSGMFEAILNNEEYKDIIKQGEKLAIIKLLSQKVVTDKDGKPVIPIDMVRAMHDGLVSILPDNVSAITTPMEISDIPFTNQQEQKEKLLEKAERGALISSGYSGALFADNGGHVGLNANIELVTSNIFAILEKIELMFNRVTKKLVPSKNYNFKLVYFRTTNLNIKEKFEMLMRTVDFGGAITPVLSVLGYDSNTYKTLLELESISGIKELLIPLSSMHTSSGAENPNEKGRPSKDEGDLTDEGIKARDLDSNNPDKRE